ncbi:MAG TPA: AbrB/MazE/SpoVT family DNA-binding domain-containing protein [Candidatus Nanoarchaeia archaeon]|nr:AbrB/MazE/SpoVT family DNA-binding domain-containing protein [Candidatus Nanoarchaeia archaeon]
MGTTITQKYQTTIPKEVREVLHVDAGNEVEWHVVRGMVIVDAAKKIKDPVKFLTSQVTLDLDMVRLVREVREQR